MQSNVPSIPAPTAAPDFPSNFGIHLFRAAHLWRREANKVLAESGFSSSVISPLMLLNELGDGMRQRDLAEEMGVEGPSLVRLLDSLEAATLVERGVAPDDRRAKTLHLTDEGRDMLVRVNTALNDVRRRLLEGASGTEIAGAMRAMAAIESNARAMKG